MKLDLEIEEIRKPSSSILEAGFSEKPAFRVMDSSARWHIFFHWILTTDGLLAEFVKKNPKQNRTQTTHWVSHVYMPEKSITNVKGLPFPIFLKSRGSLIILQHKERNYMFILEQEFLLVCLPVFVSQSSYWRTGKMFWSYVSYIRSTKGTVASRAMLAAVWLRFHRIIPNVRWKLHFFIHILFLFNA